VIGGPSYDPGCAADARGTESGYSMVEVMAAIMILPLAILPMVGMSAAALRAAVLGGKYDKARTLADERLEEIRALPYIKPGGVADSVDQGQRPCPGPGHAGCAQEPDAVRIRRLLNDESGVALGLAVIMVLLIGVMGPGF
jgi:hypothetical protein